MKKTIFIIIFSILTVNVFAQEKVPEFETPDYSGIKNIISNPDSEYYYPALDERMKRCDTTLTTTEYRMLYYGYIFQPDFSFFSSLTAKDDELTKYYQATSIRHKDYDKIIALIDQILEKDPFYLRGLNFKGYLLQLKGEEKEAFCVAHRFGKIMETILSSGDGRSPETALHVVEATHEYVVMNFLQLRYGNRTTKSIEGNTYDSFKIPGRKGQLSFCVPYGVPRTLK